MPYIQLSPLDLPSSATPATVFPFLFQEELGGGHSSYQFSLLVADENRMAQALLEALGFVKDPAATTPLPGGAMDVLWSFFRSKPTASNDPLGPFHVFTDGAASTLHALATYLTLGTLTSVTANIIKPDTLTVVLAELKAEDLNDRAQVQLTSIDFARSGTMPSGWTLRFSAADNTVDQTRVEFQLPAVGAVPHATKGQDDLVKFSFVVRLVDQPDGGNAIEWTGSKLLIGNTLIMGGAIDRLALEGAVLLIRGGEAVYEWEPTARWTIPFLNGGAFRASFAVQALRIRFAKSQVGGFLVRGGSMAHIRFRVGLQLPLIMAPLAGAIPEALSLIIPLVDSGSASASAPALKWRIAFTVDAAWNADADPVLMIAKGPTSTWNFSPTFLGHDWPVDFSDLSSGLALGGFQFCLADLLGDVLGPVQFDISPTVIGDPPGALASGTIVVPLSFRMNIGNMPLRLDLKLVFDLRTFRLANNRVFFTIPVSAHGEAAQVLDLGAFAIMLPLRDAPAGNDPDGYIDFEKREFVLKSSPDVQAPRLLVPGNLIPAGGSQVTEQSLNSHEETSNSVFRNRLLFELQSKFNPDHFPDPSLPADQVYLRINGNGISLHATVDAGHSPTVFAGDDMSSCRRFETAGGAQGEEEPDRAHRQRDPVRVRVRQDGCARHGRSDRRGRGGLSARETGLAAGRVCHGGPGDHRRQSHGPTNGWLRATRDRRLSRLDIGMGHRPKRLEPEAADGCSNFGRAPDRIGGRARTIAQP